MSTSAKRFLWSLLALALLALGLFVAFRKPAPPPPAPAAASASPTNPAAPAAASPGDPAGVRAPLDQALALSNQADRVREFGRAFALLVQSNPEAALAYVRTMPPGIIRTSALMMVLDAISRVDMARALTLARELATSRDESDIYSVLFARLAETNAPDAVQRLAQVPPGLAREKALRALTDLWTRTDAPAALAWAQALGDPADRNPAVETALASLAATDPLHAIELAQKNLTDPALQRVVLSALQKLTETDPLGASSLVSLLPPGETQNLAAVTVARALAVRDTGAALAWYRTLPTGAVQRLALNNILTEWVRLDATAAGNYVAALPPDRTQHDAAVHLTGLLTLKNPLGAIAFAQILPGGTRVDALTSLANEWARREPAAAVQWAAAQPTGAVRADALTGAFSYWMLHDANAARAWLATAPLPAETKAKLQSTAR